MSLVYVLVDDCIILLNDSSENQRELFNCVSNVNIIALSHCSFGGQKKTNCKSKPVIVFTVVRSYCTPKSLMMAGENQQRQLANIIP